ncbi:MAG: SLC13 family permease [Kiritimatiellia bacterium]|jgi:Na+/H+ antiporter NhaD/arsenite permease-like protein
MKPEPPRNTLRLNIVKIISMAAIASLAGWLTTQLGTEAQPITTNQVIAVTTFIVIILATLLFWELRLAVAFIGISVMLATNVATLPQMMEKTELHIILFLVGMMTLVGVLKDLGLFTWIIQLILNAQHMTGKRFVATLILMSGILASLVDEVTSIVFVLALVFQVCDTLKLNPVKFVLMSVLATNIGSTGTMLGNPVGLLIGTKTGLSFADFLTHAAPIMFLSLGVTMVLLMFWARKDIAILDERLAQRRAGNLGLGPLVRIPYRRGLFILISALVFISLHSAIERRFGLAPNTMLIVAPLTIAGVLMIYRRKRARHYIETEVEWWTLIFFLILFSVAGALETTGITDVLATRFTDTFGTNPYVLTPLIVGMTAIGSAFVDNIVFVAAFIPIVNDLLEHNPELGPLRWAMLFGSCFGGNITAIGSTANIVALGMMEKRYGAHIGFFQWLKIGLVIGLVTCAIATLVVVFFYY